MEPRGRFRIETANREMLKATGLKRSQMIDREIREVIPEPSCSRVLKKYREAIRTRKPVSWHEITPFPAGLRYGEVTLTPQLDRNGRVTRLFGVVHDTTKHKHAEQALHESEERYRMLAEHADGIVTLADIQEQRLYVSPSYFRKTGWTQADLVKSHWTTRIYPDDLELVQLTRAKNIAGKRTTIEHRVLCKGRRFIWVESTCKPILDNHGRVAKMLTWSHDITARKEAEAAISEGEAKFRAVFEQAAVGVAVIDTSTGRFLEVNRRACKIARLTRKEMLATTYRTLCHPDDASQDDANMERLKAGEISSFAMEKRYLHSDGSVTWFKLTVSPAWKKGEPPLRHIAIVDDITERKTMEAALLESEARYERAARGTNEGLWEWDIVRNKMYLSPRWKQLLGFAEDELPSDRMTAFYDRLHPDDAPRVHEARVRLMPTLAPYSLEVRLRMKSGEYRWFQVSGQAEGDAAGSPIRMTGTMADITERKKMELALRESEQRLRAVFDQASLAACTIDIATDRFLEVNDRYCAMSGRTREQLLQCTFVALTHPDDVPANWQLHQKLKAGTLQDYSLEKRYIRPDGSIVWGHVHASRIAAGNDDADRLLAIVEDITDRKRAEENYHREVAFNETLANHTSAIIVLLDNQGRMMHVNDATLKMLAFRRDELIGRTPWGVGIMDAEEAIRARERLARLIRGEVNPPRHVILHGKDGTPHHVELSSTTTRTADGQPDRFIVTGTDLGERNRLQNEILRISEQEQARIGHNLHDGVGQTMTGLSYLAEALEAELAGDQQAQAARIRELVQEAIIEIRQMSHGLSPTAVKNRGLDGALQLLAATIRTNHRTACELELDASISLGDAERETHIYRIAQEAANNALRHGKPTRISISLLRDGPHHALLTIEDDGIGFKKVQANGGHGIGTRVMEYRANSIGGTLDLKPLRKGVTVLCRFPIHAGAAPAPVAEDIHNGHGHGI